MLDEHSFVALKKEPELFDLAGEKAMIDFETGKYFLLKGTANEIWEKIQTEIRVKDLVDGLVDAHEVDRETCLRETLAFLQQLNENALLQCRN